MVKVNIHHEKTLRRDSSGSTSHFPSFAKALAAEVEVTLTAGDVLYVPPYWMLHTEAMAVGQKGDRGVDEKGGKGGVGSHAHDSSSSSSSSSSSDSSKVGICMGVDVFSVSREQVEMLAVMNTPLPLRRFTEASKEQRVVAAMVRVRPQQTSKQCVHAVVVVGFFGN